MNEAADMAEGDGTSGILVLQPGVDAESARHGSERGHCRGSHSGFSCRLRGRVYATLSVASGSGRPDHDSAFFS